MTDYDVLIAGLGPAGSAAAISLADRAPHLSICLVDPGTRDTEPIGETVPPQIEPMLAHLGLWRDFATDGHEASYRTRSAWAGPQLESNEFLFHTQQVGWRLDRARFDRMMRGAAERRVTARLTDTIDRVAFSDGVWQVRRRGGATLTARVIVDATGRAAMPARLQGMRRTRLDRLVGCSLYFEDASLVDRELIVEAVADGWWYTAALPAGRRIAAFMTDADLARSRGTGHREPFLSALRETQHVAAATAHATPIGTVCLCGAGSQITTGPAAGPLVCVGDAASSFDPVSGQGIAKALRSAIFASYAIVDWLARGDDAPLRRYRGFIDAEFSAYRSILRDYYVEERRWPDRTFWQRRHGAAS